MWDDLSNDDIINGTNEDGVRYLGLFLHDYTKLFKPTGPLYAGCKKCLHNYINEFKNNKPMENTCNYKLLPMFEGITLFGTGLVITNKNITDKIAKQLIKEHPHGVNLFDIIPEEPKVVEAPKKKK